MLLHEGGAEDGVLPVGALAQYRRVLIFGGGVHQVELLGHVDAILRELAQIHQVERGALVLPAYGARVFKVGLALLAALGGDEHHAVGRARTVDGRGRSVLENLHRFDVVGRQIGEGRERADLAVAHVQAVGQGRRGRLNRHAVDDVERLGVLGVERGRAANLHLHAGTGLTRVGHHLHAGSLALQGLVDARAHKVLDVFGRHRHRCAGKTALLHCAVAHHHHVVELGGLGFQRHVDDRTTGHVDRLGGEPDERERQLPVFGLELKAVAALEIGY